MRSYFARVHLRAMSVGDEALFHHSNVTPPGVAGRARIVRTGVIDETQFDPKSPYHDARATRDAPVWDCVDVAYVETFPHYVTMDRMRADPVLADMLVLKRGMRLSVQPVTEQEFRRVVALGHEPPEVPPVVAKRVKRGAVKRAPASRPVKQAPRAKRKKAAGARAAR